MSNKLIIMSKVRSIIKIQDSILAENLNQTILNLKKSSEGVTGADTIMAKINVTAENAAITSKQLTDLMYR